MLEKSGLYLNLNIYIPLAQFVESLDGDPIRLRREEPQETSVCLVV